MRIAAILILLAAIVYMGLLLFGFWQNSRKPLPKNLPPPLPDEPEDDWGKQAAEDSRDPPRDP